ncbi:MAG: hypothetical protein PVG89_14155 [Gammaproteobacteria bacterium]|jgi:hypothetical protein
MDIKQQKDNPRPSTKTTRIGELQSRNKKGRNSPVSAYDHRIKFTIASDQAVAAWQTPQSELVTICPGGLPVAVVPS